MDAVYFGICLTPLLIFCLLLFSKQDTAVYSCYNTDFARNLCDYNFQLIGTYDFHTFHSLRVWCYSLEVKFYRDNITEDIHQTLVDWNTKCNVDPNSTLNDAIESAHTMFLQAIDIARENKRQPAFGVPVDFDYKQYGRTLHWNDYVDMNTIIGYVNDIVEVHDGQ